MGFFSWDCKHCGHPMLSPHALEDKNGWMNDVVVLEKGGSRFIGEYDGYGRVNGREIHGGWTFDDSGRSVKAEEPCCYHLKCWEAVGKPDYTGPSRYAADQGFFYEDGVHNSPPPGEPGFFKESVTRERIECEHCGSTNTKQWDVSRWECLDCGEKTRHPDCKISESTGT